jgi:hypothetical protein
MMAPVTSQKFDQGLEMVIVANREKQEGKMQKPKRKSDLETVCATLREMRRKAKSESSESIFGRANSRMAFPLRRTIEREEKEATKYGLRANSDFRYIAAVPTKKPKQLLSTQLYIQRTF